MTRQLEKGKVFKWTQDCQESFEELKKRLTTTPVLVLPDLSKKFDIYYDTSRQGLGCVLMQDGQVVSHSSCQLKKHEENYSIHDLKLAAMVHALKIWRHYLIGHQCEIYSDHKSLKYIFTRTNLNLWQHRWLELIKDYDTKINYHPGKMNVMVDALSHEKYYNTTVAIGMRPELHQEFGYLNLAMVHETPTIIEMEPTLEAEIRKARLEDEKLKEIQQLIKENKTSDFTEDDHGTLWLRSRICVPNLKSIRKPMTQHIRSIPTVPRCTRT
jgi:hypothetical protein